MEPVQIKWFKEACFNEAQKYDTKLEFSKNAREAFNTSLQNGWIKDYTWFEDMKKPSGYWTRERCYNEARKYSSNKEFRKGSGSAYTISVRNGWIGDYTWFEELAKPKGYWTKEKCYDEAKKYKSRADFNRNCRMGYEVARKNGWLNDYTWFKNDIPKDSIYVVYCYKDEKTNTVYVGLTKDIKQRHRQHKFGWIKKGIRQFDIVYKYFNSVGKEVPDPVVLEKDLVAKDAQIYEKKYVDLFQSEGLNVLNLAKTGSLGGFGKWNKETCFSEAQKYSSKLDFRNGSYGAYQVASKNGWLDGYDWLDKQFGKWNKETCFNEAKKFKSRVEFQNNARGAYNAARKNGWLEDYTWLERPEVHNKKWNRETCYAEAKKYKSRNEFQNENGSAYGVALTNGWLIDYIWFSEPKTAKKWTRESCYVEAKKYKSRNELNEKCVSAYNVARKNGWLDDYTWFSEPKTAKKWTRETCYEEAVKYDSKPEFRKKAEIAYNVAYKNGWIADYVWLADGKMPNGYWTQERCYDEAKKYKSRAEFCKNSGKAYRVALKSGWLDDYTWFNKLWGKWNREACYTEAKKYRTREEFRKKAGGAYAAAYKYHWLDDYTWFENKIKWNRQTCENEARKYNSRYQFQKGNMSAYQAARKKGWLDDNTWFEPTKSKSIDK